ncbi:MAG TPA: adenylate/guanylate cyclase domain-containing protein [Casimicrobiaceae bacterium]|nr:adenylate/guanylate cyclase domain-containing protein [Casimicrobiaceae bacterium]
MQSDAGSSGGRSSSVERRLATILMADVFGYSRMMGQDEERTVQTLRGHREVFDELLKAHKGRVFNTAGDAILAEFPSAVEAVRCATEIQTALRTRNEHLPEDQRMWFRVGINLGDVIVQGGDLLGDGVNVAARIQAIADPGGICISGSVYDQIQNKLTLQIKQLGEKSFKNIAQPVRTFSISDDGAAPRPIGMRWRAARKGPIVVTAMAVLVLIGIAAAGYWMYRDYGVRVAEETLRAEEAKRAADAQLKAEQAKASQAVEQREARLLAELQSAKDALTQAEASKRKAEQDRAMAEAAQRETRLQGELNATKDALQKAAENEKKAEEERQAAMKAAEAAAKKADAERAAVGSASMGGGNPRVAARTAAGSHEGAGGSAAATGVDRFDGAYLGRMCSVNPDGSPRCWPVQVTVSHGALSATWPSRFNNQPAHAKGTIAPDGTVKIALDGWLANGRALTGDMTGSFADNKITATGAWSNSAPINATWTLTP